ncbi:VOC family protein [Streptomyces sp. 549]|uniref:VOC family protein n=1 Tax=Streptomyces sp. 549 TaxID=3049076 RepID=UPI0024C368D9|nr:VOC family protein [Streptomyces sp. 549]MDK1474582.1 VOC family protein [Streptomyces sp. 549]
MSKMVFVNLPVKDLDASVAFFTALGFTFNAQFTDEKATCMVISDTAFVMLLTEPFYQSFTPGKELADTGRASEVIMCVGAESRAEVDSVVERAASAGGSVYRDPMDEGGMYARSFQDPDGHIWEVMWMDPSALQG